MSESEPTDDERELAHSVFNDVANAFDIMLGAKEGKLDTPVTIETSAAGSEAEALGSARHIADVIEEADHGYSVEIERLGKTEPLPSQDERWAFRLTVTED